jgi:hypothetical protein
MKSKSMIMGSPRKFEIVFAVFDYCCFEGHRED